MSRPIALLVLSTLSSARAADYDGDGYDDLVVGVPGEDLTAGVISYWNEGEGAVALFRGSAYGVTVLEDALLHQDTTGVSGANWETDMFGTALAAGDIDGDGIVDLIVGGPGDTDPGATAGSIWCLELEDVGRALTVSTSTRVSQTTSGVPDTAEDGDEFGSAVVVADLNGDGYDDIVVGIPGENVGRIEDAGAVQYLRGGSGGLLTRSGSITTGQIYYDQGSAHVEGTVVADDRFGSALAAGDFDADGYADLAIGVPGEDWSGADEGAVQIMYGSSTGPGVGRDELWTAGGPGTAGTLHSGNVCGSALAVGDFDDDGYDDLAVGCPGDESAGATVAGSVLMLYGSSSGLDESESWSQDSPGVRESGEGYDRFGAALTSAHFDDDGYADLAIGAPYETRSTFSLDGVVHVLMGSGAGLTDADDLLLEPEAPNDGQIFGAALTSGDYNGDGRQDLAVGSPWDDDNGENGGSIEVFYGTATGPTATGAMKLHQDVFGVLDSVDWMDDFGAALR
jgi:hypothetical protein